MNKYLLLIALFITSAIGGLIWSANHYHSRYLSEQQRADAAELAIRNAAKTISLFNDISGVNTDEHQNNSDESQRRIVYIRQAVKDDACTDKLIPASATDSLRKHAERIRSSTSAITG